MIGKRLKALRRRLEATGARRADLCVTAYCHAFDVEPEAKPDGGEWETEQ